MSPATATRDSWPRIILHADMDAFYAAVEQRDHPEWRGKPLVVGGSVKRGVVSTASYEARRFGLRSAMPMAEALRRCPDVIVVAPDFERYKEASQRIHEVFDRYSPLVEPLSLDEAFIDMTGAEGLFGTPEEMARQIKKEVFNATDGLTISIGASVTKYVAKVASDFRKPDGLTLVPENEVRNFLRPLPVSCLWGVGPKSRKRVEAMGLRTIGEVARTSPKRLLRALGSLGEHIFELANGRDPREVIPERDPKSIGKEVTLEDDIVGGEAISYHLLWCAEKVARRVRKAQLTAGGVRVKLKTAEFNLWTRQAPLEPRTSSAKELYRVAVQLLAEFDLTRPIRLVGLAVYDLDSDGNGVQGVLFKDEKREKQKKLDAALDAVLDKFGDNALKRGSN